MSFASSPKRTFESGLFLREKLTIQQFQELRAGKGMLKVARECGIGSGTVQRIKQEMKGPFAVVAA